MIQENKSISAIVPFYNEEKYIKDSVNRLIKTEIFNQIILVNDSSQDGSRNIASELSEKHQSIILVDSSENKGKGTMESNECSGRGLCDRADGLCKCFKSYMGHDCSQQNSLSF